MTNVETAAQIVDLSSRINAKGISPTERESLIIEQKELWDAEHRGRPYEAIEHDAWLFRRYP